MLMSNSLKTMDSISLDLSRSRSLSLSLSPSLYLSSLSLSLFSMTLPHPSLTLSLLYHSPTSLFNSLSLLYHSPPSLFNFFSLSLLLLYHSPPSLFNFFSLSLLLLYHSPPSLFNFFSLSYFSITLPHPSLTFSLSLTSLSLSPIPLWLSFFLDACPFYFFCINSLALHFFPTISLISIIVCWPLWLFFYSCVFQSVSPYAGIPLYCKYFHLSICLSFFLRDHWHVCVSYCLYTVYMPNSCLST